MTKKKRWIVIFLAPGLLLFVFVFLISIVQLGITSFTDWTIGTSPTFAGLKNYIYLFTEDEDFRKVIVNTIIWIVLTLLSRVELMSELLQMVTVILQNPACLKKRIKLVLQLRQMLGMYCV